MTDSLRQHSRYAAFDCPNKTNVMIITLGTSVTRAISKADVKVQRSHRDQRKLKKINMALVQKVKQ